MNKVKKIIKKIPLLSGLAKLFYDWQQEKRREDRVGRLIKNGLSFVNEAPPKYVVGYEPTIRCNLQCKMCYQGQTRALRRSELGTSEVLEVFKKIKDKTKEIKLVGGEPFIRNDIWELIDFWNKENIRIILQTNLTLISQENIKLLKDARNVSDILTSLDGPPDIHDAVRGVRGAFNKFKKAVELIKQNRPDIPITVFATMLIQENLDSFYKLIDVCKSLNIRTLNILFEQVYTSSEVGAAKSIFKEVFGWGEEDYRLNTQIRENLFPDVLGTLEFKKQLKKIRFYGFRKGCFVNFVPFGNYQNPETYLAGEKSRFTRRSLGAGGPFCLKLLAPELRINQTGDVIWCDVIEKSFGNLLEKTPDEIWLSEDFQKFRRYLYKNSLPICRRCCKVAYVNN